MLKKVPITDIAKRENAAGCRTVTNVMVHPSVANMGQKNFFTIP